MRSQSLVYLIRIASPRDDGRLVNIIPFAFLLLLSTSVPMSANAPGNASPAKVAQVRTTQAHTPAKGSRERTAITKALRVVAKDMSGLDVVFVFRHLRVNGNWAWVDADPRSVDGSQHYESISGLLARKDAGWIFVEGPPEWPICEQDPDCFDSARYFKKIAQRHPGVSPDIFPRQ